MTVDTTIEIEGLEELQRAFEQFPEKVGRGLQATTKGALGMLRGDIAQYPPSSAANNPPGVDGYAWYERGYGTRTVTGRGYPTSEALGRSWTTKVERGGRGILGRVGTRVSYARYVQDRTRQARWHAARGWRTVQDVVADKSDDVRKLFAQAIRKILSGLTR
jgi:hypothetical protein